MLFWTTLLGVAASFCGAVAALALHLDLTMLEGAFLGAFIGSSPLILLPNLARRCLGPTSEFCDRGHLIFRLSSLAAVALMVVARTYIGWPNHGVDSPVSYTGLIAALLATWFAPHFPRALRAWWTSQWTHMSAPASGATGRDGNSCVGSDDLARDLRENVPTQQSDLALPAAGARIHYIDR